MFQELDFVTKEALSMLTQSDNLLLMPPTTFYQLDNYHIWYKKELHWSGPTPVFKALIQRLFPLESPHELEALTYLGSSEILRHLCVAKSISLKN